MLFVVIISYYIMSLFLKLKNYVSWSYLSENEYLTIRLRAWVFYEQIVKEAQPSWLSLIENNYCFSINLLVVSLHKNVK